MKKFHKINGFEIRQVNPLNFIVKSESDNEVYEVTNYITDWHCKCPDHILNRKECKHIKAVKEWLTSFLKEKVTLTKLSHERHVKENVNCKLCGSDEVVKDGHRKTRNSWKQRFRCKRCGYRFTVSMDGFYKMRYKPKVITLALDLYFKGVSLRKITDHLKQFYDIEVHHTTILYWIRRYVKLIDISGFHNARAI